MAGKPSIAARRKARRFALQALYQIRLTGTPALEVERQFREDHDLRKVDREYFSEVLHGAVATRGTLDEMLAPCLDRPLAELDPIEHAILHIGAWELVNRIDIPYRVVINEGVELAKLFGASESFKYINSILDKLAAEHRQVERTGDR